MRNDGWLGKRDLMTGTGRISGVFLDTAGAFVADRDLVDVLHGLVDHVALVSDADSVVLVLADRRGRLQVMAASTDHGRALERFELKHGDGPCSDCLRSRQPVVNGDLTAADPVWPQFARFARDAGFRLVYSVPLRLKGRTIGALNLFATRSQRFAGDEARVVQSLAGIATIAIVQQRRIARAEAAAQQLQEALASRIVIEQAKGALHERDSIDVDEAFRAYAGAHEPNADRCSMSPKRSFNPADSSRPIRGVGSARRSVARRPRPRNAIE